MRKIFIQTLTELAEANPEVVLLTGDLGYMALEPFAEKFPGRFFNVGVAEQNMVGIATGLAEAGFLPFVYSIVPFAVLRPYEFIRNGPLLHHLPVRIVGMGGGVDYGVNGLSHYGLEDIGVMRIQPGMTVIAPADPAQARNALLQTYQLPGPVYYRLGKDDRLVVQDLEGRFELGRAQVIRLGKDLLILATGSVTSEMVNAVERLSACGVDPTVMVVSSFNPGPVEDLIEAIPGYPLVVTVEAHYIWGGLGSFVAEVMTENNLQSKLHRFGVRNLPDGQVGGLDFMYQKLGLSAQALSSSILSLLENL